MWGLHPNNTIYKQIRSGYNNQKAQKTYLKCDHKLNRAHHRNFAVLWKVCFEGINKVAQVHIDINKNIEHIDAFSVLDWH